MERACLFVVDDLLSAERWRAAAVYEAAARLRHRLLVERQISLDILYAARGVGEADPPTLLQDLRRLDEEGAMCLIVVGASHGGPPERLSPTVREAFPELAVYEGASRTELLARCALGPARRGRALFVLLPDSSDHGSEPDAVPVQETFALARLIRDIKLAGARSIEMPADRGSGVEGRTAAMVDFLLVALLHLSTAVLGTRAVAVIEATQVGAAAQPIHVDDNVQFTVYRPKVVRPNEWYELLAFAHLADRRPNAPAVELDPVEEVRRQARALLGSSVGGYGDPRADSMQGIPKAGELTFLPQVPGVEFNPERITFRWLEDVHRADFKLRAGVTLAGQTARGHLSVYLGAIIVAEVSLAIGVDWNATSGAEPTPPLAGVPARPYRRIFASYSHKDTEIVEQFELLAHSLGDEYLRDVISLRSGAEWDDGLLRLIEQADVFQLFWSTNSMRSAFVQREWEYALQLRRPNFIRPTYWEEPLPSTAEPELPPANLRTLHFHQLSRLPPTRTTPSVSIAGAPRGPEPPHRPAEPHIGWYGQPGFAPQPGVGASWPAPQAPYDAPTQPIGQPPERHAGYGQQPDFARQPPSKARGSEPEEQYGAAYGAPTQPFGPPAAPVSKRRSRLFPAGAVAGGAVAAVVFVSYLLGTVNHSSAPPATSSPTASVTSEPTSSPRPELASMSVEGATVLSGSPAPRPGGPVTVFGVGRGERVSITLNFAAGNAQTVLAGAELRCLDHTGQWVTQTLRQTWVTLPATEQGKPDSARAWQSDELAVPESCRADPRSEQSDGEITGWARSDEDAARVEVVARIKLS